MIIKDNKHFIMKLKELVFADMVSTDSLIQVEEDGINYDLHEFIDDGEDIVLIQSTISEKKLTVGDYILGCLKHKRLTLFQIECLDDIYAINNIYVENGSVVVRRA